MSNEDRLKYIIDRLMSAYHKQVMAHLMDEGINPSYVHSELFINILNTKVESAISEQVRTLLFNLRD